MKVPCPFKCIYRIPGVGSVKASNARGTIIPLYYFVFVSKNSRALKAEGIPYDKGQR